MAYQKTQWQDHIEGVQVGTPVNAPNMNKMEDGIAQALPASAISSGSNSNGSWIKLPGNVMICWGTRRGTTNDNGSIPGSTVFPAPFASAPSYIGCLGDWSHPSIEYVDLTASNVRFVFRTYSGGLLINNAVEFKFVAIGSW